MSGCFADTRNAGWDFSPHVHYLLKLGHFYQGSLPVNVKSFISSLLKGVGYISLCIQSVQMLYTLRKALYSLKTCFCKSACLNIWALLMYSAPISLQCPWKFYTARRCPFPRLEQQIDLDKTGRSIRRALPLSLISWPSSKLSKSLKVTKALVVVVLELGGISSKEGSAGELLA